MSDEKISAMPAAAALTGAELVPLVQSGGNVKSTALAVANTAQTLGGTPTAPSPAVGDNSTRIATTAYVQAVIAGINPAVAVQAATTAAGDTASFVYNNGAAGIGATLTGAINTAVTIDGYTFTATGQRLLVKNDTQAPSGSVNGVYSLTQLQTGLLAPIFTRAGDYDQPSDINNTGAIPVINGTANGSTLWVLTSQVATIGTDPLTYADFSGSTLSPANPTATVGAAAINGSSSAYMRADAAPPLAAGSAFAGPRSLVYMIGGTTTQHSHTGDTSETLLVSQKIPANLLGANGGFRVSFILTRSGANGVTFNVRFGAANDLSGTQFGAFTLNSPSTNTGIMIWQFTNRNATNVQCGTRTTPSGTNTIGLITSAIDTTADSYVVISGTLVNGADSCAVELFTVEFLPAGGN